MVALEFLLAQQLLNDVIYEGSLVIMWFNGWIAWCTSICCYNREPKYHLLVNNMEIRWCVIHSAC